ncbi:TPA_asm: P [Artemisia alphacytorhabdovirus 2]|nr:TPA_asm: P [Artemisia alphacytorhabdovirus 2]
MASMGDLNFNDLPDPILDLQMSQIGTDDHSGNDMGHGLHNSVNTSHEEGSNNTDSRNAEYEEQYETDMNDDLAYDPQDVNVVLEDLQHLCNKQGLSYTIPMENQVKAIFREQPICYSHLQWYLRGFITANQTQIIPTINTAMADMKMETRNLQQSSNKINKETASLEKLAKSIITEIGGIEKDIKESFRESIKLFVEDMKTSKPSDNGLDEIRRRDKGKEPMMIADLSEIKNARLTDEKIPDDVKAAPATTPSPSHNSVVKDKFIAEKLKALIRYGMDPEFVRTAPAEIIDVMYPDDVHAQLKNVKLTPAIKEKIRQKLHDNLNDVLDESEGEEEEGEDEDSE